MAGTQRASSPALMTKLCSVIYGRLPYHAPASKDAIPPCMAVYCYDANTVYRVRAYVLCLRKYITITLKIGLHMRT